jgi:hypothetical protein
MTEKEQTFDAICWEGNWSKLPQKCGGNVQVWDQTVGCPECGMNIWYLPQHGQWPEWDKENEPPADWWEVYAQDRKNCPYNPYDPYVILFDRLHPFQFERGHDHGDEDKEAWIEA